MAIGTDLKPTLLVGVGGTGCEIADAVYAMAVDNGVAAGHRIAILGFDTDANDMKRHRHLTHRQLIRTSTPATVFRLLYQDYESLQEWFVPDEQLTTEIRQMNLMEGAGQVRMLSRLALQSALDNPQIRGDIENALGGLASHAKTAVFGGHVNVLLVGSLAGGTGSGMFLQTALLLGHQLRAMGISPELRGLFLLPDIFIKAARLPTGQIETVKANGYAALRELNAIMLQTAGRSPLPVKFGYARGLEPVPGALPLRNVVLMDYENAVGGNLGRNFAAYKAMAARAAYTLMFTPIGERNDSIAVNAVRDRMAAAAQGDVNYYAGIGVGALVYPQDRMLDYLALRFGLDRLEGDWLKLDGIYNQELRHYQQRVGNGETNLKAPLRSESYIRNLDTLAKERVRFFRDIHDRVYLPVEDKHGNATVEVQHEKYLDALERHIKGAFWKSNDALAKAAGRLGLAGDSLSEKETLLNDVRAHDQELRRDRQAIEDALEQVPFNLFYNVVPGADTLGPNDWQDYHLQAYLLRAGPHLVQVRYFLYQALALLEKRKSELDETRKRQALDILPERTFDDPATPEVEKAADWAEKITDSRLPAWLDRRFGKFTEKYRDYYNRSLQLLRGYAEAALLKDFYGLLERHIRELLDILERFFGDLAALYDALRQEVSQAEAEHQPGTAPADGNLYVFADRQAKQILWEELRQRLSGASDDGAVNTALTRALYQRFQEERSRDRWQALPPFSGAELFRRQLIEGFCRRLIQDNYGDLYKLTVVDAARREALLEKRDWKIHLHDIVERASYQSEPYLAFTQPDSGERIMLWAVSPLLRERIGDAEYYKDLFTRHPGESPVEQEGFPAHTLLCMNTRINLTLRDLRKLHPGQGAVQNVGVPQPGAYYQSYREMIERILLDERERPGQPPRDFTPHLDRHWHKPGVLPEIFPEQTETHGARLMDAYVLGVALGLLTWEERHGRPVAVYYDWQRRGTPEGERILGQSHDDLELLEALRMTPQIGAAISERAAEIQAQRLGAGNRPAGRPEDTLLYSGLRAPQTLARILRLSANRNRGPEADSKASQAVAALVRRFRDTLQAALPHLAAEEQQALIGREVELQIREALEQLRQPPDALREETLRIVENLARGTLSRLLDEWSRR